MTTLMPSKPKANANEEAILKALGKLKPDATISATLLAAAKGVEIGRTSIYAKLRKMKDAGLVIEKNVRRGATTKGDRIEFRLSAKGRKRLEKL